MSEALLGEPTYSLWEAPAFKMPSKWISVKTQNFINQKLKEKERKWMYKDIISQIELKRNDVKHLKN